MDPALWELLGSEHQLQRPIEAIVRLHRADQPVPGLRLVARFGRIATCRLAAGSVTSVRRHPNVASLKAARGLAADLEVPGHPDGPRARRLPFPDSDRVAQDRLTGAGVVVGVVDWGLDFDHPDLKNGDGSTRLLALWDQRNGPSGTAPSPYGYGVLHRRREIDRALRGRHPFDALGYHPAAADRGGGAHGTHVAAIAAGNGLSGGPAGLASRADLVFVHLADRGTGGLGNLGDSVRLLEAVDFVARTAGTRPWVVNLSVGRHGGPHDGSTLVELALDELLTSAAGRFVVQSAGNYHASRTHASGQIRTGQTQVLRFEIDPADTSRNEMEAWYRGSDELVLRVHAPGSGDELRVRLGEQADVVVDGMVVGRAYHRATDPNNGDNHIDVFLDPGAPSGSWTVSLQAVRVVDGRWHAWLERDDACRRCQPRFVSEDADSLSTIGTIANGRLPLVVGAYDAHAPDRPVARFSSSGPTRDHREKPDLLAAGVHILAARSAPSGAAHSTGDLVRKSGTSMAAPHVTGAVALCLQAAHGRISAPQVRDLLLGTAEPVPGVQVARRAGHGYLDVPALEAELWRRYPRHIVTPKENSMDTELDPFAQLALAPARAYRELMYRPHDELARWILERFVVVGGPGHRGAVPARDDVLLTVVLGHPGVGRAHLVGPAAALPSPLPPGSVLLRRRETVGRPDGGEQEDQEDATPQHVRDARQAWKGLFGRRADLAGVTILDIGRAPSPLIRTSGFTAWTNSPSEVYVASNPGADRLFWEITAYHEAQHIRQFREAGGTPPDRYATMLRYECEAYTKTLRWLRNRRLPDTEFYVGQLRDAAKRFCDELTAGQKARLGRAKEEQRFCAFLVGNGLLPPHTRLADLYEAPPAKGQAPPAKAHAPADELDVDFGEQAVPRSPSISTSFPPAATATLPDIMQARPKATLTSDVPTQAILELVEEARRARGLEPGWAARLLVDVADLPKVVPTTTVHVTVVQTVPFEVSDADKIRAMHRFAQALHPSPPPRFDLLTVMPFGYSRPLDEAFGWPAASIAGAAGLPTRMTVDEAARYKLVVYAVLPQKLGYWVEPRDFRSLRGFAFGRATLTPDHEARLVMLAREIVQSWHSATRVGRVVIQGHTDPVGELKYNEDLGRRRAEAVAKRLRQLVNRFAGSLPAGTVDRMPFVVETYGETRPISRRVHSLNRRVEVALHRDHSAPPVPLDMDPLVVKLEGLVSSSTLPADTKKRLTCMLGKVKDPASDDRFVNDMQVFLIKRDRAMPGPTEWSRVRNLVLNPALFGPGRTDAQLLDSLRKIDGEIIEGVMRMNQIIDYASGGDYGLGLSALPTAFKQFNIWVLARLKDPKSVYSCHPQLRP